MINVIIPTLGRPHRLISTLQGLKENSKGLVEVIIIADEKDRETIEAVCNYGSTGVTIPLELRVLKGHPTPIEKWNHGARNAKDVEWIMLAADDIVFTHKWDIISVATPNYGFLALRDSPTSEKHFEPHYMATRDWLRTNNGGVLACPHYKHWCPDVEIADRARALGHYVVSEAIIPHNHVIFETASNDATYEKGKAHYAEDLALLHKRQIQGYLNDFESYL